ncbi:MAG: hypothetical protein A2X64_05550 [Ignavibacteria bacterium GWF2_33_9]|nr:MAG: hypothetical protein A2X64_05550 [Ignavibacteria bacterium GWF2_33_9]
MSIISDTSYPGGIYDFYSVAIHPTSGKMALYMHDSRWNDNVSTYTSKVEKIEIWDIKTLSKEREIMTKTLAKMNMKQLDFSNTPLMGVY